MHFRGPLLLKQFAAYKSSKAKVKRNKPPEKGKREIAKMEVGNMVTPTINGQVVSWINEYNGHTIASAMSSAAATNAVSTNIALVPTSAPASTTISTSTPAPSSSQPPSDQVDDTHWQQHAYYNMENQTVEGLTFLNNMGSHGLAFPSVDGSSDAANAQIFKGELKSQQEIVIFSGVSCDSANCGFVRPGSTAYGMCPIHLGASYGHNDRGLCWHREGVVPRVQHTR